MLLILLNTTHFDEFIDNIEKACEITLNQPSVIRNEKIQNEFSVFSSQLVSSLRTFSRGEIDRLEADVLILLNELELANTLFREFIDQGTRGFAKALKALKIATQSLIDFSGDKLQKLWTLAQELLDLISLLTSN